MNRVLVTGASGFVGRHVLAPLAARGFEVHTAARSRVTGPVVSHAVDVLDASAVDRLVRNVRPSHLLHLAWYTAPGAYWHSPKNLDYAAASLSLIRSFAQHGGQRFVGVGSCAEYLWTGGVLKEGMTPLAPATLYGTAKHAVRLIAESFAVEAGFSAAWARLFFLYGPDERPERLVPTIVRALLAGKPARCSPGTQQRDFMLVEDAADALAALVAASVTGPVNVASGCAIRVADVATIVGDLIGAVPLVRLGALPAVDEPSLLVADVTRLRQEVGWNAGRNLEQGLARTVDWWRARSAEVSRSSS